MSYLIFSFVCMSIFVTKTFFVLVWCINSNNYTRRVNYHVVSVQGGNHVYFGESKSISDVRIISKFHKGYKPSLLRRYGYDIWIATREHTDKDTCHQDFHLTDIVCLTRKS